MKFDGTFLVDAAPRAMVAAAVAAEERGYDGWFATDSSHDPFLPLAIAAERTERIELGTAVAVAFARSPMTVAYTANDLQLLSGGRFTLGLGSQVEAHVTRRFSMPWSDPVARMREYVQALREIWDCWNEERRLDFRGAFYRHDLMTPNFTPRPNPYGRPKVFVAALGARMSEMAGEVADGVILHPFTTPRHLRGVTLPAIERGLARSGRRRSEFEIALPCFAAMADTADELRARADATRERIAFYGSTPAYRGVLDLEGHDALYEALHARSRNREWSAMAALVGDEVLDRFSAVGTPDAVGRQIAERFGGIIDRVSLYLPYDVDLSLVDRARAALAGNPPTS